MNMHDYIPRSDENFHTWVTTFVKNLAEMIGLLSIPAERLKQLEEERDVFDEKFMLNKAPATRTTVSATGKANARKRLEKTVRQTVAEYLSHNHALTNTNRIALGLPVRDTTPTPAPIPEEAPSGTVDVSKHQQHGVRVTVGTLTGRTKPPKVRGYEVWRKVGGTLPVSDEEWTYAGFSSRSRFLIKYPMSQVGQTVYYCFRWVNTRNQPGPWSSIVNAVIA